MWEEDEIVMIRIAIFGYCDLFGTVGPSPGGYRPAPARRDHECDMRCLHAKYSGALRAFKYSLIRTSLRLVILLIRHIKGGVEVRG